MAPPAATSKATAPILLEDDFSNLIPTRQSTAEARSPVLGAVLLGGLIAIAIVVLAFLLRPDPTSLSDAGQLNSRAAEMIGHLA